MAKVSSSPFIEANLNGTDFVKIVALTKSNRILALRHRDEISLPCGRVEWDDDNEEAAARREAYETAGVSLGPLSLIAVTKTENEKRKLDRTFVFAGRVTNEERLLHQKKRHLFLPQKTFLQRAQSNSDEVQHLVEHAAHHIKGVTNYV